MRNTKLSQNNIHLNEQSLLRNDLMLFKKAPARLKFVTGHCQKIHNHNEFRDKIGGQLQGIARKRADLH
jgi:hypothetical protein